MRKLIEWSEGNPGALQFLMTVFSNTKTTVTQVFAIETKLVQCSSIRGANLYVLYSDLCEKDINKVVELCMKCPNHVLEDACDRQDRSGRLIVNEYFDESQYDV
jgi:hypothetical protein